MNRFTFKQTIIMKLHLPITLLAAVMSGIGYAEDIAADFSYEVDNPGYVGGGDNLNGFKQDSGATDWSVYYINTSDHEAKVSEIIEASKDAQGDARLTEIQMFTGTLDVNQSVRLMPPSTINENGEIVARPVINVSGDDTELYGMIDCATMHASGGKIFAILYGDTSLTVTGHVEITGESSQTGDTIITGPGAKLTISSDSPATALGASTVKLQNHATLDLNGKAANNMIEVTGCTVANADEYVGRMEVASHLTFVGPASAGCISLRDKGEITAESLRTTTLEALPNKGADGYNVHTITGDVTIKENGAIILYSGKQITLSGNLTLSNGVAMVLLDAGGEFAVGDILVTCTSGTITGDFSELDFLINNEEQEGYRVEITEDRKSVVLAEEDKPIVDPGEDDWTTYYINTAEHEATVSEIAEASKDDNGNVQLEQVEMKAGTLNADRSIAVNAAATTDEAGDILLRSTINMSGADTELSGSIADAIVNASGGKLSAELSGTTEMTVTGAVTVSGDNSHTGATTIRGKEAKLTVAHENALGDSVVELAEHATLDLSNLAVDNSINVTGCTLENAENYRGRMGVSGDLKLTGPTTAESVMLMSDGTISGASLRTKALEVNIYRDFVAEFASISSDVTINDGGVIVLYGGTELRISGSLTLGNNMRVVLMDDGGDFAAGDTLVTCLSGTITGDVSTLEFIVDREMQDGYVVEITDDRKSIVLAEEEDDTPIVDPDDEEDKPIVGPDVPVQPDPAPVFEQATADVLAQGNWGIFTASRAFVNAVQGQRNSMGCIANGRGTAWAALLGATHDIDGSGAAAGSDTTLFGAAVGVDMQIGKRSSLGVAFGYTDAEVKPGGLSDVDQESGYIALYGEHGLKKFANNSCLALDWVLSTGTTESSYLGADWEQDHIQANTRLTWTKKVNERFAYNVFGGVEYFASESDRVADCKSGSIQNLRGELGVGARYVVKQGQTTSCDGKGGLTPAAPGCDRIVVYGELSYINDMVRNNPSIEVNGLRGGGANPGRQGVGIEAGATFRIGERWSANANYSFNAMDDSNEHVLNIGASRTF